MKTSDKPVEVVEVFDTDIKNVWKALTNLEEMKQWYFDNIDSFEPVVGSESCFPVESGERTFTHLWKVTEVKKPVRLTYNWKYAEYEGDSFVSFILEEKDQKTFLTLRVEVVADFQDGIPEFNRESCLGGWEYFINRRLKAYLK